MLVALPPEEGVVESPDDRDEEVEHDAIEAVTLAAPLDR